MAGLDPFYNTFNNPSTITLAAFGDSTTEGNISNSIGGWPEQVRVLSESRWGRGGDGFHPMNRDPWALTASSDAWTKATVSDAWDCAPQCGTAGTPAPAAYMANGASKIATWTKPSGITTSAFSLYMVDGASSGNFSYSTDGGSTWINVAESWSQNNAIKIIRVEGSISSTVKIRAANAAGTAVNTYLAGLESHTNSPGFVIHNVGANSQFLASAVRTTAGNWHGWLDVIQPKLTTLMFTNDVLFYSAAAFQANLETFVTTVTGYGGSVLFMNFFEQNGRSISDQASMRSIVKSVAASFGMPVIDFYDLVGDFNAANTAGYMGDNLHPSDAGAIFMAQQIWKLIAKSGVGVKRRIS